MSRNERVLELIENLAECCRDSQKAFLEAAERVSDLRLRNYFNERSLERAQFAGELLQELRMVGEHHLRPSGTAAGSVQRAWMEMKNKLGGGDHTLLSSLEACEDSIKHAYQEVMQHEKEIPNGIMSLVRSQAQSIYISHDYIRNVRDRKAAA